MNMPNTPKITAYAKISETSKYQQMAYLYLWHRSTYSRGSTAGPTISIISLHKE